MFSSCPIQVGLQSYFVVCLVIILSRIFKDVCGKCDVCAKLSELRQKFCNDCTPELVRYFHGMHRSTYMGERAHYQQRKADAEQNPTKYVIAYTNF